MDNSQIRNQPSVGLACKVRSQCLQQCGIEVAQNEVWKPPKRWKTIGTV